EIRAKGIAVMHFVHGEEITTVCRSRQLRSEARRAVQGSNGIVAVSSFTHNRLIEFGADPAGIHLIQNGGDLTPFTPGHKSGNILERHGLHGKKVLLTVARLEEKKGQDKVISALPRILASVPEVVYVIVGKGAYEQTLVSTVSQMGLADKVIFAGSVPNCEL